MRTTLKRPEKGAACAPERGGRGEALGEHKRCSDAGYLYERPAVVQFQFAAGDILSLAPALLVRIASRLNQDTSISPDPCCKAVLGPATSGTGRCSVPAFDGLDRA